MKLTGLTMAGLLVAGAAFANTVVPDEVSFGEYGAVEASLRASRGGFMLSRRFRHDTSTGARRHPEAAPRHARRLSCDGRS